MPQSRTEFDKPALIQLIDFTKGRALSDVRLAMVGTYNKKSFKQIVLTNSNQGIRTDIEAEVRTFLNCLNISNPAEQNRLVKKAKTLYDLLALLVKDQDNKHTYQLKTFIKILKEKPKTERRSISPWAIIRFFKNLIKGVYYAVKYGSAALVLTAIGLLIWDHQKFFDGISKIKDGINRATDIFKQYLSPNQLYAGIGGVITLITTGYRLGKIALSDTKSRFRKWQAAGFTFSEGGLTAAGYVMAYLAKGFGGPITTGLFAGAASVAVVKHTLSLIQRNRAHHRHFPGGKKPHDNSWVVQASYLRSRNSLSQHRATLGVKIGFALANVAIVALWCAFPVFTPLFMALSILVLPKLQTMITSRVKRRYQNKLQKDLSKLSGENIPEVEDYTHEDSPQRIARHLSRDMHPGQRQANPQLDTGPNLDASTPQGPPPPYYAGPGEKAMTFWDGKPPAEVSVLPSAPALQ